MAGANRFYIQIDVGSDDAEKKIEKLNQKIDEIGKTTEKTTKTATGGMKSFALTVEQSDRAVQGFMSTLASLAAVRLAQQLIATGDAINRVQISLKAMTGSATYAAVTLNQIKNIAAESPFAFQDLADASRRLAAFGFTAREIPGSIQAISKAVATIGGGTEEIDKVTNALGIMREKGVAQAMQLFRGLAAQGIPVMEILRKKLQEQTGKLFDDDTIRKLMEKGELAGEATARALIKGMAALPDATKDLMETPTARIQKMKDEFGFLAQKIESDVAPQIIWLIDHAKEMVGAFENAPKWIRNTAEALLVLGAAITTVAALAGFAKLVGLAESLAAAAPALGLLAAVIGTAGALKIAQGATGTTPAEKAVGPIGVDLLRTFATILGYSTYAVPGIGVSTMPSPMRTPPTGFVGPIQPTGFQLPYLTDKDLANLEKAAKDEDLIKKNIELAKQQREEAAAVLARAQEQELGGIAAVTVKYDHLIDAMKAAAAESPAGYVDPKALADLERARQIELAHVREEAANKARAEEYEATKRGFENQIALAKDAYTTEAEMALAVVAETPQKEAAAQADRLAIITKGAEDVRQITRASADAEFAYKSGLIIRDAAKQMAAIKDTETNAAGLRHDIAAAADADLKELDRQRREAGTKADIEAAREVEHAKAEIIKQSAAETTSHLKAAQAANDNARIASAERQVDIQRTMIEEGDAQTARDKYKQIQMATEFEIAAAQHVAQVRDDIMQENLQKEIDGLEEKYRRGNLSAQQARDQEMAAVEEYNQLRYGAEAELADRTTKLWLDAQKQVNEAWISEQKAIFDKFESSVGQLFDTLFEKGKSFGRRMLDMLTGMGKDALKSMVVPTLSASLMTAMGMPVHIERHDYGTSAAGQIASLFGGTPVFGAAPKLEHPNILDIKPVAPGGYAPYRLPVDIGNLPLKIDLHQTGSQTVRVESDGGGGVGLGGLNLGGGGRPDVSTTLSFPGIEDAQTYTTGNLTGGGSVAGMGGSAGLGSLLSVLNSGAATGGASGLPVTSGGFGLHNILGMLNAPAGGGGGGGRGGAGFSLFRQGSVGQNIFSALKGLGGGGMYQASGGLASTYGYMPEEITSAQDLPLSFGQPFSMLPNNPGTSALAGALGPVAIAGGLMGMQGAFKLGQFFQNRGNTAAGAITGGALGAFSGLLAAGGLAAAFPSLMVPLLAAGPIGWIAAAGIGAAIGLIGAFKQTDQAHARDLVKRMYGIDISNISILNQIVGIAKQNFGGQIDMAVASPQVQQLVNLYAAATGQGLGRLPRPMYPATFAEGAGGLTLQPTYSNGQLVTSPYSGMTTTTWANYQQLYNTPMSGLFIQLDPNLAQQLFAGNVINVLNNNPSAVGGANANSVIAGNTRTQQLGGLLEPATVTS